LLLVVRRHVELSVPSKSRREALWTTDNGQRKRARERYDEEFSAEDWADRLRTLYDEVLRYDR
jgi:hypothetical protein